MLGNNFRIKLTMLSDWQIGTGAGIPGSVDELVSKDADGFPQVPAKTLVGIWRDAMETLCDGLGGNWSDWVETIFGAQPNRIDSDELRRRLSENEKTYSNSILSIQPARISENLRAKINSFEDKAVRTKYKQALTFVKVGVKIDGNSGTSETDALRFEEMGRIDSVLDAGFDLDFSELKFENDETKAAQIKTIKSLLVLSAELIERIGGKRRRGAGKCQFTVENLITKDQALEHLKSFPKDETPETPKRKEAEFSNAEISDESSGWQTCEYTLTLETPVSIVTAVLGNVSETLDFIPGTYLISHFVKNCGQKIFKAIQDGDFQISPATICIDNKRGFPVPKVFAQEKMKKTNAETAEVYNRLLEPLEGKSQTKPIRDGFIADLNSNAVSHAATPLTLQMHNAVDDDYQRPTTDVIGIYSREAIKAGTILKGEIRFRKLKVDCENLKGKVRLGTSKKDSGSATIKLGKAKNFEAKSVSKADEIVVYIASDVMLRNENLRQTNLADDLAKALGLKGEKITFQQIQVRRIESWQTSWGFPRPTLTLMQAGSVVRFKTDKTIDFAKIEAEGIGERRGEGYGQIIFNPKILEKKGDLNDDESEDLKLLWKKSEASKIQNSNSKGEIEDKEFAKLIEKIAWQEELKIAVSKIAAEENLRKEIFGFEIKRDKSGKIEKSTPAMSQISGLRSAVMRLQSFSDNNLVIGWLKHLKETDNRIEKWDKNKNKEQARRLVNENLIPIFENSGKVWDILGKKIDEKIVWQPPKSLELEHDLKDELWAEAVKSLFYACQQAHKRDTEKEDKKNGAKN